MTELPPVRFPVVWGDTFWGLKHNIAAAVEDSAATSVSVAGRAAFLGFLCGEPELLPCISCREDAPRIFAPRLAAADPRTTDLVALVCDLHNDVNRKLGKAEMPLQVARQRAVDLNMARLDCCLVWRFIMIVARSQPKFTATFKRTFSCLAAVLRELEHHDLAEVVTITFTKRKSNACVARIFPMYQEWHGTHQLPCALSLESFLSEHSLIEVN